MVPYRQSPSPPAAEPWSPAFGEVPWSFSSRFTALPSRRELIALAGAVLWADAWCFGVLARFAAPRMEIVLAGWMALLAVRAGRPRSRSTYAASLLVATLALMASAWNGGVLLGALALVAVAFVPSAARLRTFSVLEPLGSAFTFGLLAVPRGIGAGVRKAKSSLVGRNVGTLPWLEVGVALGLLGLFGGLFTLANPFVRESTGGALDAVIRVFSRFDRLALRAGGDLGFAIAFLGLLRSVPSTMLITGRDIGETTTTARVGRMAAITLVMQNALFAVYNAIDAVFLGARVAPPGMTLQKYAHDGAFWLTVTLAFVTLVAYAFRGAARTGPPLVRKLMTAWIVQGLLLGVNVFFRLVLHVRTSGLSNARFEGVLGASAVVGGLCAVWWTIRRGHSRAWILRAQASIFAAAVVLFVLLPTNLLAALYDVHAIGQGARLPLVHVVSLSEHAESAPSLLALLDDDDPIVREGVAALLLQRNFDGSGLANLRAEQRLASEEQRMRDMLRSSNALHALVPDDTASYNRGKLDLDGGLIDAAAARFRKYVLYMDDQDANISPRLPEDGTLLVDPNAQSR